LSKLKKCSTYILFVLWRYQHRYTRRTHQREHALAGANTQCCKFKIAVPRSSA